MSIGKKAIKNLDTVLFDKFGYEMKFFRPPKGEFSERVIKKISDLGYKTVMWSSAYDDWDNEKYYIFEYGNLKDMKDMLNFYDVKNHELIENLTAEEVCAMLNIQA